MPATAVMAVPVTPGQDFGVGAPVVLFDAPLRNHQTRQYDVAADGQHFLLNRAVEGSPVEPVAVIQNWEGKVTSSADR